MSNDAITLWTGGGLVAAGVVAGSLAGALLTNWLGVRRDQRTHEHDQAMAREAHSHEQAMAREAQSNERAMALQAARHRQEMAQEARCQERLEKAYLELLTYLSHFLDWAKSVQPIWGPVPMPDPVPPEERRRIEALVTAYGSPEVLRLLHEWGERAAKVDNADATVRLSKQSRNPSEQFDQEAMQEHRALPEYKQAMIDADKAIRDRVQRELAGEV